MAKTMDLPVPERDQRIRLCTRKVRKFFVRMNAASNKIEFLVAGV